MRTFILIFHAVLLLILAGNNAAGENSSRFLVEENTVVDSRTGLMWAKEDNDADINLENAKKFCENFSAGGFSDWRLPSQAELATLYDEEQGAKDNYSIISQISISGCCLWASDTRDSRVASFDFDYGNPDWGHPNSTIEARVLPVRDN